MAIKRNTYKNIFDTPVNEYFPMRVQSGDIGLEIEAEGTIKLSKAMDATTGEPSSEWKHWMKKNEPSLRNGVELALAQPVKHSELGKVMDEYRLLTRGSKFVPSIRTSIHIHCNIQPYMLRQVYSIFMIYWMFENILVRMHGPAREGNLHCLRLSDSSGLFQQFMKEIEEKRFFHYSGHQEQRYAALNPAAIPKFGSAEYRFMKFPDDLDDINKWALALHGFTNLAARYGWEEIPGLLELQPMTLLQRFWPASLIHEMQSMFPASYINSSLYEHADLIYLLLTQLHQSEADQISKVDFGEEDMPNPKPVIPAAYALPDQPELFAEAFPNIATGNPFAPQGILGMTPTPMPDDDLDLIPMPELDFIDDEGPDF